MNRLKKAVRAGRILVVLSIVSFAALAPSLLAPTTAYADTVDTLESNIKDVANLRAFKECIKGGNIGYPDGGLSENLRFGDDTQFFGRYFMFPGEDSFKPSTATVAVGYLIDREDGMRNCDTSGHMNTWAKLIGYADAKDFRDKNYSIDNNAGLGWDDHYKANGGLSALTKKINAEIDAKLAQIPYTDAHRYVNAYESFSKCANINNRKASRGDLSASATILQVKNFITPSSRYIYDSGSGVSYFEQTEADQVPVGHQDENDDGKMQCSTLASRLEQYSAPFKSWLGTNYPDDTTSASPDDYSDNPIQEVTVEDSCESKGGLLSWIMCPAINLLGSTLNWVDTQLTRLLEVDRNRYDSNDPETGANLYKAWSSFRNIGLTLLIAIMLVMIVSTALGVGAFDAYTVKKAFPRMIAAVIFMTLSWYVCVFLIDITNNIGRGVLGLMTQPFGSPASLASLFSATGGGALAQGTAVTGLAIGVGVFAVSGGIGVLFGWLVPSLTIMIIAFITLVARQLFILVLVLFAPLAILSWIFPGNEKLWKFWWQTFSKLLLMFPIVMALIASGRIFAGVVAATDGSLIDTLLKLTAYIVPYIFIPFTFKAAGGAFGAVTGMLNDRSKGIFDRSRKMRHKGMENMGERAKSGNFMSGEGTGRLGRRIGKINAATQKATLIPKAGINPRNWAANIASADTAEGLKEIKSMMNNDDYIFKADDTANAAANDWARTGSMNQQDLEKKLRERGYADYLPEAARTKTIQETAAAAVRVRRQMSGHAFEQMTAIQAIAGGTEHTTQEGWAMVGRAAHGNQAALANMVAMGRSAAMSAGRIDQGGASFGATLTYANTLANLDLEDSEGQAQAQELTESFKGGVLDSQGPGVLLHSSMKPRAIEELIPVMRKNLEQAYRSGDEQTIARELAGVHALYDNMAATSPNKAKIIAEELLQWTPDSIKNNTIEGSDGKQRPVTILDEVTSAASSGSEVYASYRRELGNNYLVQRDAAERQIADARLQQAGVAPTVPPIQPPLTPPGL